MTEVRLFQPLALRRLTLDNRVAVAPMCQYSAVDGVPQAWHLQHYGSLVASGPGLVVFEATAILPEGRITPGDLGLWSDGAEAGFTKLVRTLKSFGRSKLAVQIAHAGRKGSSQRPWEGGGPLSAGEGAWQTLSASALPFAAGWHQPRAAGPYDLDRLRQAYSGAVVRAHRIGFDAVELHAAHGYLLHQFLSPLTNQRTDVYGGSLENRLRFPLEVVRAVRQVWPTDKPLGIRVSATDWVEGGLTVEDSIRFLQVCKSEGVDYVCVSSGGLVGDAKIPLGPGYQVALAERVRRETGLSTRAVGLITDPRQAEEILAKGQADWIALGRAFLDDPRWLWHAAAVLGADHPYPPQYVRAGAKLWPGVRPRVPAEA